jgi:hydroxymethylglutaryl-CoA lyase/(R)-citramalyl-CoA lyase
VACVVGVSQVTVYDVGPRDGLQNEPEILDVDVRAELVGRLVDAGLPAVEIASFVDPRRVPQMAGAEEVVAVVGRRKGIVRAGLALNEKGYERLLSARLDEVRFAFGVTESFNRRNQGAAVEESLAAAGRIAARARGDGLRCTVTLSVAFGCPYEGEVDPDHVVQLATSVAEAEPDVIVLADTIGVASPRAVRALVERVAGLGTGASVLDASVGGLGGCPFAPRATGNIATEDLVYALEREGVETGIDLDRLIGVADWLEGKLGRRLDGQLHRAGTFPRASPGDA